MILTKHKKGIKLASKYLQERRLVMSNKSALKGQFHYKLAYTTHSNRILKSVDRKALVNKLKAERLKIRTQLAIGSYVDSWPYITVLPEKLRGRLLHKLRLVDEAIIRTNKFPKRLKAKKRRLNNMVGG